MNKLHVISLFMLLVVTLTMLGLNQVFAVNTQDSSPWIQGNNYAMIAVRAPQDCSGLGGDSDNDGICNNWEDQTKHNGLHISFLDSTQGTTTVNYTYNLSCVPGRTISQDPTGLTVCPDPNKKDIYVELDWMTGQGPNTQAIADVVKAFDKRGIELHVQYGENTAASSGDIGEHFCFVEFADLKLHGTAGQACSTTSGANRQAYGWLKQNFFGNSTERAGNTSTCPLNQIPTNAGTVVNANAFNCLTAKRQVFHYSMYVNYQYNNIPSSGWSENPGNDFVMSLGNFVSGTGNIDQQEASFMHELGHNLGLHHGGMVPPTGVENDDNCKPNYLSIMSYTYEFRNNDVCRPLDFSNGTLATLNEPNTTPTLSDSNIGSYQYPADNPNPPDNTSKSPACPTNGQRDIWWSKNLTSTIVSGTTGVTNDWDQNGQDVNTYKYNLNDLTSFGCGATTFSVLKGFNDWNFTMNYTGNTSTTPPIPPPLIFRPLTNFYQGTVSGNGSKEIGTGKFVDESTQTASLANLTIHKIVRNGNSGGNKVPADFAPVWLVDSSGTNITMSFDVPTLLLPGHYEIHETNQPGFTPIVSGPGCNTVVSGSEVGTVDLNSGDTTTCNITNSHCLIATAAFGSELAPPVQFLRDFRDYRILSTADGASFMTVFNAWYYSFSPSVADYERGQPWMQQMVRTSIYPLLGILTASEKAYSVMPGEYGSLSAGLIASSAIGALYFWPFALLLPQVRQNHRFNYKLVAIAFGVICAGTIASIVIANQPAMMVTTSLFVLSLIGIFAVISAKAIVRMSKIAGKSFKM